MIYLLRKLNSRLLMQCDFTSRLHCPQTLSVTSAQIKAALLQINNNHSLLTHEALKGRGWLGQVGPLSHQSRSPTASPGQGGDGRVHMCPIDYGRT